MLLVIYFVLINLVSYCFTKSSLTCFSQNCDSQSCTEVTFQNCTENQACEVKIFIKIKTYVNSKRILKLKISIYNAFNLQDSFAYKKGCVDKSLCKTTVDKIDNTNNGKLKRECCYTNRCNLKPSSNLLNRSTNFKLSRILILFCFNIFIFKSVIT